MGVKGVWKLLESSSRPISSADALRGQIAAIDVSMWSHRLLKGVDSHDRALLIIFSRICKLLYYGIRPVFIFDGAPPAVKLETQRRRRSKREATTERAERLRQKLLEQIVEMQATVEASKASQASISSEGHKSEALLRLRDTRIAETSNDIFKLSVDMDTILTDDAHSSESEMEIDNNNNGETPIYDDENDETLINSTYFKHLPAEVRHEMLMEMREKRKYAATIATRGGGLEFLPQLKRALTGSKLAAELRETRRELAASAVERAGVDSSLLRSVMFSGGAIDSTMASEVRVATGIAGPSTEYVLVRNRSTRAFESLEPIEPAVAAKRAKQEVPKYLDAKSLAGKSQSKSLVKIGIFDSSQYTRGVAKPEMSEPPSSDDDDDDDEDGGVQSVLPTLSNEPSSDPLFEDKIRNYSEVVSMGVDKDVRSIAVSLKTDSEGDSSDSSDFEDVPPVNLANIVESSEHLAQNVQLEVANSENKLTTEDSVQPKAVDRDIRPSEVCEANMEPVVSEANPKTAIGYGHDQNLESFNRKLDEMERNKRAAAAPDENFFADVAELCRCFGFPVVEAPAEAEAQAAALDAAGLINFCITDDSDYFLFGGQRVIRGLFGEVGFSKKHADCFKYEMTDIEEQGLSRLVLVCIALISGCDYCDGLRGCGPAMAVDIWKYFNSISPASQEEQVLETVRNFKEAVLTTVKKYNGKVRESHLPPRKAEIVERFLKRRKQVNRRQTGQVVVDVEDVDEPDFPSTATVEAFLQPRISEQLTRRDITGDYFRFFWKQPDMDKIKAFAENRWKWKAERTESVLAPVLRQFGASSSEQPTLEKCWHIHPSSNNSTGVENKDNNTATSTRGSRQHRRRGGRCR